MKITKNSSAASPDRQFPHGLTLDPNPISKHLPGGVRDFPSDEVLLQLFHDNVGRIVDLTQDVFIHSTDLILLDRQHGLFGGGSQVLEPDAEALLGAEEELRSCIYAIQPQIPRGWIEWGNYYFLPALTMGYDAHHGFASLTRLEQLEIAYATKREFVKDNWNESAATVWPDWWQQFGLEARVHSEVKFGGNAPPVKFDGVISAAFWLERVYHRQGKDRQLLDGLDRDKLAESGGAETTRCYEPSCAAIRRVLEEASEHNGMLYYGSHPSKMP